MKVKIVLSPREVNKLEDTIEILEGYSELFKETNKAETFSTLSFDNAGTAVNCIKSILEEVEK